MSLARENLSWEHAPFEVPGEIYNGWDAKQAGAAAESAWTDVLNEYRSKHAEECAEFERRIKGDLPADWNTKASEFVAGVDKAAEKIASRKASQNTCLLYTSPSPRDRG